MFRPRIIPVLLLKSNGLVKSVNFKNHRYIGDPINAVRIFNDLKVDELVFLDIDSSFKNRIISLDFVRNVGDEANMPFAVGGGIKSINDIKSIITAGAEKVIIGKTSIINPDFIKNASGTFGSSTIVVCMDVRKNLFGKEIVYHSNGKKSSQYDPIEFAQLMEAKGAGELIVQSISRDGLMSGYDIDLIKRVSKSVMIPVIALGGAGKFVDLKDAFYNGYANGLAAGSMFVYHGERNGILINYIDSEEKKQLVR
jgi:cyclase